MGVPTMRVRAESVPTFNFLQKWFRTLAKGETKSNKNKILKKFDIRREPKGSQREPKGSQKGAKDQENNQVFFINFLLLQL